MFSRRLVWVLGPLLGLVMGSTVGSEIDKPLKNEDVVSMVAAKLPESTIIMAVKASKVEFDISASELIALTGKGVPKAVVEAMIVASSGAQDQAAVADQISPEEITVDEGSGPRRMRYITPDTRQAVRAFGYGGFAQYSVLHGPAASLRLTSSQPSFVVAVPSNAQAQSYVTLVSLAVRRNGTREVMIGGGYMSYSSGINKDRVVEMTDTTLQDQSRAPEGYELHEIRPAASLAPGEYAVVLYNSEVKVAGWFASGRDSYFDFGIDRS